MGTIQIVCVGHSGSSIINLILGRHDRLFSVGEIRSIYKCYPSDFCACGKKICECEFWKDIIFEIKKLDTLRDGSLKGRKGKAYLTISDIIILFGNKKIYYFMSKFSNKLRTTLKAAKKNYEVLQYINKKVEHHVLIDSSKNPIRGRLLFELDNTTKFIYLKGDGRGITNSWVKAYKFSFKYSLFQWILRDLLVKLYIFLFPKKTF